MAAPPPARTFASSLCHSCRLRLLPLPRQPRRDFRTFPVLRAEGRDNALANLSALSHDIANRSSRGRSNGQSSATVTSARTSGLLGYLDLDRPDGDSLLNDAYGRNLNAAVAERPYRLHVYSTKHNTHLTLVQPPKSAASTPSVTSGSSSSAQNKTIDVLLSISSGNIGFRKAGRGSYDAAYQLAAFMIKTIQEKGILAQIRYLEVVLRGFGAGREAVTKVLLGSEGRGVRGKIVKVVDATRLKLGGPRSGWAELGVVAYMHVALWALRLL
ncbi:hypothetical protein LTR53_015716 [Teratosphaeriaceae sp. CCFEE 6253]|nr:hypothetical protein LTR53_015716 [Teratosphaeriaceae sp. CCFEE 6253]